MRENQSMREKTFMKMKGKMMIANHKFMSVWYVCVCILCLSHSHILLATSPLILPSKRYNIFFLLKFNTQKRLSSGFYPFYTILRFYPFSCLDLKFSHTYNIQITLFTVLLRFFYRFFKYASNSIFPRPYLGSSKRIVKHDGRIIRTWKREKRQRDKAKKIFFSCITDLLHLFRRKANN